MRFDAMPTSRSLARARLSLGLTCGPILSAALGLNGCASPPTVPPPVLVAALATAEPQPSRAERIQASLKAMNFEPHADGWHLTMPMPLIFSFDSDVIAADAHDNLMRVARELRALGIDTLVVRGHTDSVGSREYNKGLSKRRADAVARVLAEGGYPAANIDAKGLGSTVPIADNGSAEGRAKNRRVVIIAQVAAFGS